jgi:hypothetical protein
MATLKIPSSQGVRQLNINDTAGEIWASYQVDLHTNPNKIKLARPMKQVITDSFLEGDDVEAFATYLGDAWALTNDNLFRSNNDALTSWIKEDTGPSNATDMVVFDGQLVITTSQDIDACNGPTYDAGWWGDAGGPTLQTVSGGNPTYPFVLEVVRIGAETLAVTNGSTIHAYTGAIAGGGVFTTVDIDDSMIATCLKSNVRRVWIGSKTEDAEQAYVYEWDGASTNYIQAFPVGAKAVLSMEDIDNAPLILTERGEIKLFNGAGFSTVAQFPFASKAVFLQNTELSDIGLGNNISFVVTPKAMRRVGNKVLIAINTLTQLNNQQVPIDERSPAGIWSLDLSTYSLTHLASIDNEKIFQGKFNIFPINSSAGRILASVRKENGDVGVWLEDLSDDSTNEGYIITSEVGVESIKDSFSEIVLKSLLGQDDEIMVKYRVRRDVLLPEVVPSATWLNEYTFNTTQDLSHIKERFEAGNFDEVEVFLGSGTGELAHITNITNSDTVYSVELDRSIGTATEALSLRIDNWTKIDNVMTLLEDGDYKRIGLDAQGNFIQFKIILSGKAGYPEMREIIINTNNKESK